MELNLESNSEEEQVKNKIARHLLFRLADETYAMPLSTVKEVISMTDVTPMPHVPSYFKGVINLRGKIISIVDLRIRLSRTKSDIEPKKTGIIITDFNDLTIGSIVDEVTEVVGIDGGKVMRDIALHDIQCRKYVEGVVKINSDLSVILLDFHKILSSEELALIRNVTQSCVKE